MQIAIELPDDIGQQVLQQPNAEEFVRIAIEKQLLELKDQSTPIPPKTRSLIGLLKKSNLNKADYLKHLEEKYL